MKKFSSLKITSSASSSSLPLSKVGRGGGEDIDDGEKSTGNITTGGDGDVVAFLDAGFTFTIALGDDERRREEEEDDDDDEKNISERERAVQPPVIVLVVSYCFDISNAKVRERLESGLRKEENSEDGEKAFVFELAELTTNANDDEKEIVRVRVESEKLQKILDATPKRVQENVACVLVEMFSERREEGESAPSGKRRRRRTDAMTVIAKHTRDEATGRLKRTFVNPFLD
jgi:hypothetical protein